MLRYFCVSALLILWSASFTMAQGNRGSIVLHVDGFKNANGQVRVYLFNSPDGFPSKPKKALEVRKEKLNGLAHEMTFSNLPYGFYAIGVHHDVNGNDKLDSNWLYIPKEPTGASNNARGSLGPPSFKAAKFELKSDTVHVNITLK
jgi:uncharacterized protein (DUF2141 family)